MHKKEPQQFEATLSRLSENARKYEQQEEAGIKLFGIHKLTLLDYPQKMASTIFTGGSISMPSARNQGLCLSAGKHAGASGRGCA